MPQGDIFFTIKNLAKGFCVAKSQILGTKNHQMVVKNISLNINNNECLALVGESGSGKTTFGKCVVRLLQPDSGSIFYKDFDLMQMKEREFQAIRPKFQMIHQNHTQAFNPRQSIGTCLMEPLKIHSKESKTSLLNRVHELLRMVGLNTELLNRFPHELSGGQRQRVAIARALTTSPTFLIADEPTSSLDALIRRQIVQLLLDLQQQLNLTLLLISHDLAMAAQISNRIAVMYQGEIVELAPTAALLHSPAHPYSKQLVQSAKYQLNDLDFSNHLEKSGFQAHNLEKYACAYSSRCPRAEAVCFHKKPSLQNISDLHQAACHLVEKLKTNSALKNDFHIINE